MAYSPYCQLAIIGPRQIMAYCYDCLRFFAGYRAFYTLRTVAVTSNDPNKIWCGPLCPFCNSENVTKSQCRLAPDHERTLNNV